MFRKNRPVREDYIVKNKMAIIILGFFIILFSSCSGEKQSGTNEIYIPILADASWLNSDGAFLRGVQLAVEDVNAEYMEKGFHVTINVIDDKALYEKGVEAASMAAEDAAVTAVFNLQNFDVSKTTASILSDSARPVVFAYGAYDSLFIQNNPYVFCTVASFSDLGKAMAAYAVKQGYKRIAVYHNGTQSQEELCTAFELALRDTGSKVVDYVPSIASESEFDGIYSRWQALGVDCAVITQYGLDRAFEVLKMIRAKDKALPVLGEPIFNRANALEAYRDIAEGMVIPSTLVIEESEKLKQLEDRYREKFGRDMDIWSVQGYDMLRMIVDTAVRLNTNDPEKIAEALHDEQGYQGIGRHIAFTEGGAMITDISRLPILTCRNGVFE